MALITTLNPDGTPNISPMSSSFALGDRVVLGMAETGQGLDNLRRSGECVINLPGPALWRAVERLAPTTGRAEVPPDKQATGYRHVAVVGAASPPPATARSPAGIDDAFAAAAQVIQITRYAMPTLPVAQRRRYRRVVPRNHRRRSRDVASRCPLWQSPGLTPPKAGYCTVYLNILDSRIMCCKFFCV